MKACCAAGAKEEFLDVGVENQAIKDLIPVTRPRIPAEVRTNSRFFEHEVFDVMFQELADDFSEDFVSCSPEKRPTVRKTATQERFEEANANVDDEADDEGYGMDHEEIEDEPPVITENRPIHRDNDPVFDNMVDEPQYVEEPLINPISFTSNVVDDIKPETSLTEPRQQSQQAVAFEHREQDSTLEAPIYAQPSEIADNSFNIQYEPQEKPAPNIPLPSQPKSMQSQDSAQSKPKHAAPSQVLQAMKSEPSMQYPDVESFGQQTSTYDALPPQAQKPAAFEQQSLPQPTQEVQFPAMQHPIYSSVPAVQQLDIENLIQKAVAANSQTINEELARSQDLIQQELKIIQMQEQELEETRQRSLALEQEQRENEIEMNSAALSLAQTRPSGSPLLAQSNQVKPSQYANAKLSLSSGFLIGSQGSRELFRIDLAQPNVVQYDELALRIVVEGPEGPLFIKAQTHDDYEKWVRNISASLERRISAITQKTPGSEPKLLMMLDAQTRVLFVYENGSQTPTKQFFVENCEVTIKRDREFGVVKVRCVDGKKFSFGDRIEVCEQWEQQFESVGGVVKYVE